MKKKKIVYSLSERGLYSELSNLALAKVYADFYGMELQLNTYNWNCRINDGWEDYFAPTLKSCNNRFSAQKSITSKEKPWIGKIYYNPKVFWNFYFCLLLNKLYKCMHPFTLLAKDVFFKMHDEAFLNELTDHFFSDYSSAFKSLYEYNESTKLKIEEMKTIVGLPQQYVCVHIRRGDKITSGEMKLINLDRYVDAVRDKSNIATNIYVATDDISVITYLEKELSKDGFKVYYNAQNSMQGFNESVYNNLAKEQRFQDTINMLFDMDCMINSSFFIGSFSSNVGRVVALYLGLERCMSLDEYWDVNYHWQYC